MNVTTPIQEDAKGKKRQAKSSKIQTAVRVKQVMEWQLASWPSFKICQEAKLQWGINDRMTFYYIEEANKMWQEGFSNDKQHLARKIQARLEDLTQKMVAANDFRGAAQAQKYLSDVSGVTKQQVELTGADGNPIQSEATIKVLVLPDPEPEDDKS